MRSGFSHYRKERGKKEEKASVMGEKEITALLRDSQANNAITHLAGGEYPWIPLSHRESLFAGTSCGSQSLGLSVAGWQGGREPEWGTGFEWLLI